MTFSCCVFGNESLAIQCAELLLAQGNRVSAVVTRDAGITTWAESKSIPVIAPGKGVHDALVRLEQPIDWIFSIANLSIIPDEVLRLAKRGAINFHDGPLPKYAGLNAPSWAIMAGEREHGISWHLIEGGVDEGDILEQRTFALGEEDTSVVANTRCYEVAIESFSALVPRLIDGSFTRTKQDLSQRTYFGRHDRPEALSTIDWRKPATKIAALVRALDFGPRYANPLGVAKARIGDRVILLPEVREGAADVSEAPGTVLAVGDDGSIEVATGRGSLRFPRVLCREGTLRTPELLAADGIVQGAVLRSLDGDEAARITRITSTLAPSEAHYARALTRITPVELPAIDRTTTRASTFVKAPLRLPPDVSRSQVLSAVAAWVSRITGHPTFDLGLQSRRLLATIENETELFADVVPFRVSADPQTTFDALTKLVDEERERAAKHVTYARELYARTPGSSRPRYDLVVTEVESAESAKPAPGATMTIALPDEGTPILIADTSRIAAATVDRTIARLAVLLGDAIARPATPIGKLALLTSDETDRLLRQWNATTTEFPKDRCVHQLFEQQVDRTPDATAIVFEGIRLSYRELDARANQLAHALIAAGVGPDKLVALHVRRGPDLVIGALAIQKAGGAYVPVDPAYPADRVALYIEDSGATVVITQAALAEKLPATSATILRLDADASALAARPTDRPSSGVTSANLAYVLYTSGSTGRPKGVMVEHRNVANFFTGMDPVIPHQPAGTWLAVTSLSFDISVLELFWTLARGFTVVLSSDEDRALVSSGESAASKRAISFSLFYFASDEGEKNADKYRLLLEGAKFADTHGFEAVWTPERHFGAFGGLYPNPSVASAAIATITKHVKIRAGSCVIPLHHPARIAEEWALVDNLSNGRVGISFASGWHPNDFVFRPENFKDAKNAMVRDVETVRRLWRGEAIEFDGPVGKVKVSTLPRPVQRELPFWFTAAGNPETFAAAGRAGAGLLTHLLGQTVEEVTAKVKVYRQAWREAGHEGNGHVTLMLHTFIGDDEDTVRETARGPMKAYLRTAMNLIAQHAWTFPAFKKHAKQESSFQDNFSSLSPEDAEALLDHAFERYYEGGSLFGTPESALRMVERCKDADVDEIGCLIDYGIDSDTVLTHLDHLDRLRAASQPKPRVVENDFSIAAQVARHDVTHLQCTPSMLRMLMLDDEARLALGRIKHIYVGGEALPAALVADLGKITRADVTNMYGPTETTIWSTTESDTSGDGIVSIGRPIANTTLYVLDAQREPVPLGAPGELYIGGAGVARGYLHRAELTAERFVDDPFAGQAGARLYRTGDLVRYKNDGRLEFLGRVDHQVKIRGYRIELGEIESRLTGFEAVREGVVVAREDTPGDKRLVAYFTTQPGSAVDLSALRAHLGETLPDFMVPAHFVELAKFPLTPNNKIDRNALPKPQEGGERPRSTEHVEASNDIEKQIVDVWKRILNLSKVGVEDNFFELGGHSLLAVQAHREIKQATGKALSITDIFRFPTIQGLASFLGGGDSGDGEAELDKSADRAAARREALNRRANVRRR